MVRQSDEVWIPLGDRRVVTRHAFAHLDKCMLDMTRMSFVPQVFDDLLVSQMTAEPGVPPEQEGHEHDQPSRHQEQNPVARGHACTRLGRWFARTCFCWIHGHE